MMLAEHTMDLPDGDTFTTKSPWTDTQTPVELPVYPSVAVLLVDGGIHVVVWDPFKNITCNVAPISSGPKEKSCKYYTYIQQYIQYSTTP